MSGRSSAPYDVLTHAQRRARRPSTTAPLARSHRGRRLGGVAAGIARFVRTDVRLVRGLWIVSVLPSFGITLFGYLALWLLLPGDAAAPATGAATLPGPAEAAITAEPAGRP